MLGRFSKFLSSRFATLFGSSSSGRSRPQPRRRPLLELEPLEVREVLNATYSLSGGNLDYITSSGQQLIDTNVRSYTVVQNQVFDLNVNGNVNEMASNGSGKHQIGNSVSSLVSDAHGNLFALTFSGAVDEYVSGNWARVGT